MHVRVGDMRGKETGLFPCEPDEGSRSGWPFCKNSESSVTAALTATPSSDLITQVESFRDEQEVPLFVLLLATLAGSFVE